MYQNIFFDNITKKIHLWDDTSGYRVIASLSRRNLAKFIIEAAQVLKDIEKLEVHS